MDKKPFASKPIRSDDMRRNSNKAKYSNVPNRDKVVPGVVPHPKSMEPKQQKEGEDGNI